MVYADRSTATSLRRVVREHRQGDLRVVGVAVVEGDGDGPARQGPRLQTLEGLDLRYPESDEDLSGIKVV